MKTIKILSIVLVAGIMSSCNNSVSKKPLETEMDSISYAIGMSVGKSVKRDISDIDRERFLQGFVNTLDSTDILIEDEKIQQVLQSFFQKKQIADQAKQKEEALKKQEEAAKQAEVDYASVKAAGEKFLEANMTKAGVEITESGLQYIVLKEGTGEKPAATSTVKVHYHGTLADGTVFESTVDSGNPAQFGVGQVVKGWTEGLQLMSVGSKYKFFIPQELGYGANVRPGGKIKPFSALVFEIELLEIVK